MHQGPEAAPPAASNNPEIIAWAAYPSAGCRFNGQDPHRECVRSVDVGIGIERCGVKVDAAPAAI